MVDLWLVGTQFAAPILCRMANFMLSLLAFSFPFKGQLLTWFAVMVWHTWLSVTSSSGQASSGLPRNLFISEGEKFTFLPLTYTLLYPKIFPLMFSKVFPYMVGHKHLPNENKVFWRWTKCLSIGIWEKSSIGYPKSFDTGLTHQSSIGHLALFDQALISKLRLGVWNPSIKLWSASLRLSAGPPFDQVNFTMLRLVLQRVLRLELHTLPQSEHQNEMTFEWHFSAEFLLI